MASFEAIRDRLPSLYRPEDDDLADARLPFVAADVAEVVCDPPVRPRLVTGDRRVRVELREPARVLGVRLRPGAAASPTAVVAVYLPNALRPSTVARIRDGAASFPAAIRRPQFTLELRRRGLLSSLLLGIGDALDDADRDAALIMHAHWHGFADRARYSPFYLRRRALAGEPPPGAHDADLLRFPYVHDLARIAALLPLAPRAEERELVEAFRLRIARLVELYKDGLGTLGALQRMIEIELPVAIDAPPEERDRGLVLEEFTPLRAHALDVVVPGNPAGTVAPLMHWTVDAPALDPSPPTAYVTGAGDGAERPALELYGARLALGYRGTLGDGEMLRLRPAYSSWLARPGGVERSRALPAGDAPADPAAPGPWEASAGAPEGVVALLQTRDRVLWAATGDGALARCDGREWTTAVTGLAAPRCLAETADELLVGTDDGLSRVPLFPDGAFAAAPVAGVDVAVLAVAVDAEGWTLGTADGLLRLVADAAPAPAGLDGIAVHAIAPDAMGGTLYGTDRGLFLRQALGHWYAYVGESASDQDDDFVRVDGGSPPDDVFLPAVHALHRGPDGALWLGTAHGLARYVARTAERLAFTSALEAFPDLGTGAIHAIARDPHGVVWIGGEAGLLRADRRDVWHHDGAAWRQLGRADTLYDGPDPRPRGSWRFDRAGEQWQRADAALGWAPYEEDPRIAAQPAVRALAWTDDVAADVGTVPVEDAQLAMRFKPTDERVVDGGVPALPRLPAGRSTWRYLQLEGDDEPVPPGRPTWTREGRRLTGAPPPPGIDDPPEPARFDIDPPASKWGRGLLAFPTAARVRFEWRPTQVLSVAARLRPRAPGEAIEPAVLDRVFEGMAHVRPAGVRAVLAVDETIVRGEDVGAVA